MRRGEGGEETRRTRVTCSLFTCQHVLVQMSRTVSDREKWGTLREEVVTSGLGACSRPLPWGSSFLLRMALK
jgi:hypothetical protein